MTLTPTPTLSLVKACRPSDFHGTAGCDNDDDELCILTCPMGLAKYKAVEV